MVRIHRADGSFFVIHAEVFATEGIRAGDSLDEARVEALKERSERILARGSALRFLSRAAQTRRGLSRKLLAKGFSKGAVAFAVNRMIELGYLDDRAFAESWARFRLSTRKEGWKSLYRGLLRGGVPRAIAEEVLESSLSARGGDGPRAAACSRSFRADRREQAYLPGVSVEGDCPNTVGNEAGRPARDGGVKPKLFRTTKRGRSKMLPALSRMTESEEATVPLNVFKG